MSAILTIVLLGKPRGKQRPRVTRQGIAYTPKETVHYESALRVTAQAVMERLRRSPLQGPVEVIVEAYMPIAASWPKKKQRAAGFGTLLPTGKPDLDNILKMLDGLNGIVWGDDSQITDAVVRKRYSDRPRLEIAVTALSPAES